MLSVFELWERGNDLNHTDVWKLEGEGNTGLYMTKSSYWFNHNRFYNSPVYHVWINGKNVVSTENMQEAYGVWKQRIADGISYE